MTKKWRGISTTQKVSNLRTAVTITNRLKQKSMSLPWINDAKRWAGFPGLAGTAKKIANLIPIITKYVEPFTGSAKVYQEYTKIWNCPIVILNDLSPYVTRWLKREFPETKITNIDFAKCIKKHDSKRTFFLFDMPWNKGFYDQKFSMFNRKSVRDYSLELIELCENIKGKFIIASRVENNIFKKADFYHKTITSIYVVSGRYPKVLLTSNFKLKSRHK